MHENRQSDLPLCAIPAAPGKLPHGTMLLEVGETQFHGLTTESVEALGFCRGHPCAVGLDQCFMFTAFDGSAAVWICAARDLPWARPTMLRRTTITMHHVDLPVVLSSFWMADPRHWMALRATVAILLGNPGKAFLPDRTRLRALFPFLPVVDRVQLDQAFAGDVGNAAVAPRGFQAGRRPTSNRGGSAAGRHRDKGRAEVSKKTGRSLNRWAIFKRPSGSNILALSQTSRSKNVSRSRLPDGTYRGARPSYSLQPEQGGGCTASGVHSAIVSYLLQDCPETTGFRRRLFRHYRRKSIYGFLP